MGEASCLWGLKAEDMPVEVHHLLIKINKIISINTYPPSTLNQQKTSINIKMVCLLNLHPPKILILISRKAYQINTNRSTLNNLEDPVANLNYPIDNPLPKEVSTIPTNNNNNNITTTQMDLNNTVLETNNNKIRSFPLTLKNLKPQNRSKITIIIMKILSKIQTNNSMIPLEIIWWMKDLCNIQINNNNRRDLLLHLLKNLLGLHQQSQLIRIEKCRSMSNSISSKK